MALLALVLDHLLRRRRRLDRRAVLILFFNLSSTWSGCSRPSLVGQEALLVEVRSRVLEDAV